MALRFDEFMRAQQQVNQGFGQLAAFDQRAKQAEAHARIAQQKMGMQALGFLETQRHNRTLEDQGQQRIDISGQRLEAERGSRPGVWRVLGPLAQKSPEHAMWVLGQLEGLDENTALSKLSQLTPELEQRLIADMKRKTQEQATLHARKAGITQDARFRGTKRIEDAKAQGYKQMVDPTYQPPQGTETIARSPGSNILTEQQVEQRRGIENTRQARRELAAIRKQIRGAYGTPEAVSPASIAAARDLYEQVHGEPPSPEDLALELETTPEDLKRIVGGQ